MVVKLPNLVTPETLQTTPVLFTGPGSKTWPEEDYEKFVELEELGADRDEMLKSTGIFRGPDGIPRREINDREASLRNPEELEGDREYRLRDVIDHPEFFEAYPDLGEDVTVIFDPTLRERGAIGSYRPSDKTLRVSPDLNTEDALGTVLHEIQHVIQDKEGMTGGGNSVRGRMDAEDLQPVFEGYTNQLREAVEANKDFDRRLYDDLLSHARAFAGWRHKTVTGQWEDPSVNGFFSVDEVKDKIRNSFLKSGWGEDKIEHFIKVLDRDDSLENFDEIVQPLVDEYTLENFTPLPSISREEQQKLLDEYSTPGSSLHYSGVDTSGGTFPNISGVDISNEWSAGQEFYERLGGEVESRNVGDRRTMSSDQRIDYPPWITQDRSDELQQHRPRNYNQGGIVNSVVNDYKRVERGEMSERDFSNRHGMTTKRYEDDFMDQYGIDLVNSETTQVKDEGKKYMRGLVRRNYNQGGMVVDDITVDPVSGNPVPTGSAPSEVRDDIQANLSEGEFVVPANVVQYYGVKYFDGLINKAEEKLGDVPRGEPAEDPELEMNYNEGGLVDGMSPLTPPAQDMMEQSEGYGFKTFYGPNGEVKEIMFLNGEPQSPIPAGYSTTRPKARPQQSQDDKRDRTRRTPTTEDIQRDMYNSLDKLDFDQPDNVLGWANDRMLKPEGIAAGLLGASIPGSLINIAREARGIAEVNAAARVARAQGNDQLADELEERVAANNSLAKRMLPQEWIDGDQIAQNYTSRGSTTTSDVRPQARPSSRDRNRVPNNGKGSQEMQQALGNILQGTKESRTRPKARPTNMNKGGLVEKKKYDNDDDYVRSIT